MKSIFSNLVLALSVTAGALAKQVSYEGAKALRIPVGEDVIPLYKIIKSLDLPTWKGVSEGGVPIAGGHVDLVVPANKAAKFEELTKDKDFDIVVLHENLGASIEAESAAPASGALAARGMFSAMPSLCFTDIHQRI